MKFKVRVCTILAVTCILALQGIVSAAEEGDSKMEYSSTILEEGYTMEIAEEQKIMPLSANTSFNWTVKPKKIKASSGFKKKAGSVIRFHVNVSPKKQVLVGIIHNGTKVFKKTTTQASIVYDVKTTGTYQVFVQNQSSSTITATGYYMK